MTARRQGEAEKAAREFVKDLGSLSARQKLIAQEAYALARLLDQEDDGSKASALSRELRQLVAALTPTAVPMPSRKGDATPADKVTAVQDQLASKRRQREERA